MDNYDKYKKDFEEKKFWNKLPKFAQKLGVKTVYTALLLYYAYKRKETPKWAKRIVLGSLGYLLAPIDAIPDLTPFIGFTDDLSILTLGLVAIAGNINDEVKNNARKKLKKWFDHYDSDLLKDIDQKL